MLNSESVWLKKGELKTAIGLILSFGVIILLIVLYQNWAIKDHKETFAIYLGRTGGVGDGTMHFKYTPNEKEEVEASDKFSFNTPLKIGDTVWIKYSTYDHKIIKVIDTDYKRHMKKCT